MRTQLLGVLWDMDGTLANTKTLKQLAHQAIIDRLGGRWLMRAEEYRALNGTTTRQAIKTITASCGVSFPFEDYMRIWRHRYAQLLHTVELHPGAGKILQQLSQDGVGQIIVSSSNRDDLEFILRHTGVKRYLRDVISGDEVELRKPHPEPYLLGLARLEVPRKNTIAVEDTDVGVTSAQAAGLRVVGIRHDLNSQQRLPVDRHIQVERFSDTRWFIRQLALTL